MEMHITWYVHNMLVTRGVNALNILHTTISVYAGITRKIAPGANCGMRNGYCVLRSIYDSS